MFEGTSDGGGLFVEYVRTCLVPCLGVDDVVVWGNSVVHTSKLVAQMLKVCGVRVVCLPVCSPDFNPVELLWVYLKDGLRKLKA